MPTARCTATLFKPVIGLSFFVATMLLAALLAQICLLMSSLLSLVLFYDDWVYDLSFLCFAVLQVVKASDVLFLFGGAAAVRDTLKSVKADLKGDQIIVPVTKDGDIDNFQVIKQTATWYSPVEF